MAALRSLKDESVVSAALQREWEMAGWRREHERRVRNNHVCSGCGQTREFCVCAGPPDVYSQAPDDPGWDA